MLFSFIESLVFARLRERYLSDDDYSALQDALMARPDLGAIVPGSGGVRKMRWKQAGRGKRGGIRVIYYWQNAQSVIWLLTVYAKNERSIIAPDVLRRMREAIDG